MTMLPLGVDAPSASMLSRAALASGRCHTPLRLAPAPVAAVPHANEGATSAVGGPARVSEARDRSFAAS